MLVWPILWKQQNAGLADNMETSVYTNGREAPVASKLSTERQGRRSHQFLVGWGIGGGGYIFMSYIYSSAQIDPGLEFHIFFKNRAASLLNIYKPL